MQLSAVKYMIKWNYVQLFLHFPCAYMFEIGWNLPVLGVICEIETINAWLFEFLYVMRGIFKRNHYKMSDYE